VPPPLAVVSVRFKVLFEQFVWEANPQPGSPCKALRSNATTSSVLGEIVQEIEVMSACVNHRKRKADQRRSRR
jgi:hypothetical protein